MIKVDLKKVGNILEFNGEKLITDAILKDGKWLKGEFAVSEKGIEVLKKEGIYKFSPKIYINVDARFGFVREDRDNEVYYRVIGEWVGEHSNDTLWYAVSDNLKLYAFWSDENGWYPNIYDPLYKSDVSDIDTFDFEIDMKVGCVCMHLVNEETLWFDYHIELWNYIPDWAYGVVIYDRKTFVIRKMGIIKAPPCLLDKNPCDFCFYQMSSLDNIISPAVIFAGYYRYENAKKSYKLIIPSACKVSEDSLYEMFDFGKEKKYVLKRECKEYLESEGE